MKRLTVKDISALIQRSIDVFGLICQNRLIRIHCKLYHLKSAQSAECPECWKKKPFYLDVRLPSAEASLKMPTGLT